MASFEVLAEVLVSFFSEKKHLNFCYPNYWTMFHATVFCNKIVAQVAKKYGLQQKTWMLHFFFLSFLCLFVFFF